MHKYVLFFEYVVLVALTLLLAVLLFGPEEQVVSGQVGNVVSVIGEPEQERRIGDMEIGETGCTVPWAYDVGTLNVDYTVDPECWGTLTLRVTRLEAGYSIEYTKEGW